MFNQTTIMGRRSPGPELRRVLEDRPAQAPALGEEA